MGNGSSKPAFRALLLGLDSAGKTTLLKGLTNREDVTEGPTTTHNVGSLKLKKGDALLFDLGGQQKLITFWRQYYQGAGIILFVIDSSDTQRVTNAKDELYSLIHEHELIGIPLLVIANKQDMPGALSPDDIATELELNYLAPRQVHIIGTCAKTKQGFQEITEWVQKNAIHIVDLPKHLEKYNKLLATVQEQKQVHSQRKSVASIETSLLSSNKDTTTNNNNNNSTDVKNTPIGSNQQPQNGDEQQQHIEPLKTTTSSTHDGFNSPNHDPSSTSMNSNTTTSNYSSGQRRPRLTVSIEQQVFQSQLHQQLLQQHQQYSQQQATARRQSVAHTQDHEILNNEGIPISQRHIDEFNPLGDDIVLETKVYIEPSNKSFPISPKPAQIQQIPNNDTTSQQSPPESSFGADDEQRESIILDSHFSSPLVVPSPSNNQHAHSQPDNNNNNNNITNITTTNNPNQSQPSTNPPTELRKLSSTPPPTDSTPPQTNPPQTQQQTPTSNCVTISSPEQPRRMSTASSNGRGRRSSIGPTTTLTGDEVESFSRSRRVSLSQTQQEEEIEGEFHTNTDPVVAPFEEALVEPNLDTVNEQQIEEDADQ